jgi:sodium transport system permease protein
MRWSIIRTIWFREVRDQLRDRRTIVMLVVLPLLLYPLIGIAMAYMSQLFGSQALTIGIAGYELIQQDESLPQLVDEEATPKRFAAALFPERQDREQLRVVFAPAAELGEMLKREEVQAALFFDEEFVRHVRDGQRVGVNVRLKDGELVHPLQPTGSGRPAPPRLLSDDDRSRQAYERLRPILREWEREIVRRRMAALDKPADYSQPLILPGLEAKTERLLFKVFPFLIVMMSLTGALYPAIDVCAGEKERGTMETLLISPASRAEIVVGKFMTVWVFSAGMALLNLGSMSATAWFMASQFTGALGSGGGLAASTEGLTVPGVTAALWCVALLIPLAAFFSAVCLALAVYARSSKEGQYYLMPLMVGTMLLTILSLLPGIELSPLMSLLPVTGATLLLNALMSPQSADQFPWIYLAPVLVPLASYCYIALYWAAVQFNREEVLFREAERLDLKLWVRRLFREKEPLPSATMAIVCFFMVLLLNWFGSLATGATLSPTVIAVRLIAFVAAPAVLMAVLLTSSPRQTLRLRWPRFVTTPGTMSSLDRLAKSRFASLCVWLGGALLLAAAVHGPLVVLVQAALEWLPEEGRQALEEQARRFSSAGFSIFLQILVFALLPAICEEMVFRGFILSGLRKRLGDLGAILVSSILFAVAHLIVYKLAPTFVLGVILGMLATRSGSLFPGIVFHFTHNALPFLALYVHSEHAYEQLWVYSPSWVILESAIGLGLLFVLFRLPPRPLLDAAEKLP